MIGLFVFLRSQLGCLYISLFGFEISAYFMVYFDLQSCPVFCLSFVLSLQVPQAPELGQIKDNRCRLELGLLVAFCSLLSELAIASFTFQIHSHMSWL